MTLHIAVGLPGAGKTEWSTKFLADNWACVVSKDIIRREMLGVEFDQDLERDVRYIFGAALDAALWGSLTDIVIDNTNLTRLVRAKLIRLGNMAGHSAIAHVFDCDPYVAWDRKHATGSKMSRADFGRLMKIYEPVGDDEGFMQVIRHDGFCPKSTDNV